jgi:predicted secreted protein
MQMPRIAFGPARATAKTIFVPLAFAFAASLAFSTALAADSSRSFGRGDDNSEATIGLGDTLSVRLPVQMETGACWKVVGLPETLERDGARIVGDDERPGAIGTQVFWFRARKKGIAKLALAKRRPWEFADPPLDTFQIKITVEGPSSPKLALKRPIQNLR